ncbi:asparagine synthase (glutamine-hydrolyzing) [Patescibacteria group bacterium]|nr:asparagine synthase (glutamine-hydrolyzing) [Patescibacteria group bacterium]MBU1722116.1 asparagine synthase (glutamine-hydrolyzing) [Patescibacteria group bacterium]MBU1901606.1 asparagine synthase (glutamine-hydrolyzing) [Patescibacteria group bacterium]
MCGIIGGISKRLDKSIAQDMLEQIRHRGPDGDGLYCDTENNVYLGHTRLAIIGLSYAGAQPMTVMYKQKKYIISYNGEVYNYKEIKKELQDLGHEFVNETDTEVIAHAYIEWGINESIRKFIGMFVFALWDDSLQKMYIVRDRFGVKPLYILEQDGSVLFASELKALLVYPEYKKQISQKALQLYFQLGYIPAPYSIFEGICKVLPGHYLEVAVDGSIVDYAYWDALDSIKHRLIDKNKTEKEYIDELEQVLQKSFDYRMVADVDVGVFLSGGIDSSLVAALLQKGRKEKIKTFTIGFEDSRYDEAPYAKKIAEVLGTDHHEIYLTEKDVKACIPQLFQVYDEPFADSSAIPTYLLAKYTKDHVKVALSGDGGDELFSGYTKYKAVDALQSMARYKKVFLRVCFMLPISVLLSVYRLMVFVKLLPLYSNIERKLYKLKKLLAVTSIKDRFIQSSRYFSVDELKKLGITQDNAPNILNQLFVEETDVTPIEQMQLWDLKIYFLDDILVKTDRMTMAHGVEGREPFLDESILSFVSSLPKEIRQEQLGTKKMLKQVLGRHLDQGLFEREKSGFVPPIGAWLTSDWGKKMIEVYLSDEYIKKQHIFSLEYIQIIRKDIYSVQPEKLWMIIAFQLWYEEWMV